MASRALRPRAGELLQAIVRYAGESDNEVAIDQVDKGRHDKGRRFDVAGLRVGRPVIEALVDAELIVWRRYAPTPTVAVTTLGRIHAQRLADLEPGGSS